MALTQGSLVRAYYLLTPLFLILDARYGISIRASGLTVAEYRYLYYGFCLLCAAGCYWQTSYTPLIAMAESSVNLFILLLGVMLPIFSLVELPLDTAAVASFNGEKLFNFLITGIVLVTVFQSAQRELRRKAVTSDQQY
jgi:hypothetical protein